MSSEDIKIGVFICHCGSNIAGKVDVKRVADYASQLSNVTISREYKYMCSDPGQGLIIEEIENHNLNRIVVAACSPLLHEPTFRNAVMRARLNPYLFQMVNIREHNSWVTTDPEFATKKAIGLIRAAVSRVTFHEPLERATVSIKPEVLIVGGGIAGIQSALTIANAGKKVFLVEREPTIGGHMAMFDKTFPTLDCSACILTPKMSDVGSHPNIELLTLSEVTNVEGYVGNFNITVRKKPRYIIEDACVGCMECIEECIYKEAKFDNEFNQNLSKRKPVYIPFPQATPQIVTIDPETCIELKTGTCKQTCVEACGDRNAIDLKQKEEIIKFEVSTIIVSTGFQPYDASKVTPYGYGKYKNVYTSLEVERLLNSSGPTDGRLVLKDGREPKSIGIIHCVGSRDENHSIWCSRVCCMYSLKFAHLIKDRVDADVYQFYIDIRAFGKGYEEFYHRLQEEGVVFIKGKPGKIMMQEENGVEKLIIQVEDVMLQKMLHIPVDMVILSVGLEPRTDAQDVRRMFNLACSTQGFFLEKHPKLAPVSTFINGVFIAGACQFPMDIPDTVAQAGAAASEVLALISSGSIELEPNTANIVEEFCSGCRTCIPLCPFSAISRNEEKGKAEINPVLCTGCGTCVAACPSGAIRQKLYENDEIFAEIKELLVDV
ncbi:MAG: CoB--CoM heterodisulfide reductase iron-sulfur subunit A [Candidatus Heimdallarchaeota archaeon LC_3]|nr:MAG: CoB--CoM heterodisulfide reductase iron-sulfur subunit A [Candidatus Heimdallarchaeota archaeon LC_3]